MDAEEFIKELARLYESGKIRKDSKVYVVPFGNSQPMKIYDIVVDNDGDVVLEL